MQDPHEDLLDQPVRRPNQPEEQFLSLWRYVVTLILFPAALLRLRSGNIGLEQLVLGSLWSSFQYLCAGAFFAVIRWWFLKRKGKEVRFMHLSLRTAVELVIFVGIVQILWRLLQ